MDALRCARGDRRPVRDRARGRRRAETYSIAFEGIAPEGAPPPQSDAYTAFSVTGGAGGSSHQPAGDHGQHDASSCWTARWRGPTATRATTFAIAASINAGASGFIATATQKLVFLRAPSGSGLEYNNATVDQVATGNLLLAYGSIARMGGGSDETSAGEVTAYSSFLILGDTRDLCRHDRQHHGER